MTVAKIEIPADFLYHQVQTFLDSKMHPQYHHSLTAIEREAVQSLADRKWTPLEIACAIQDHRKELR